MQTSYGRVRMHQALLLKRPENVAIPSERTVQTDVITSTLNPNDKNTLRKKKER